MGEDKVAACPVCWSDDTKMAYGAARYQYQCNTCGFYGLASDDEVEALGHVFEKVPGARGLLLDCEGLLELAWMQERDRPNRRDDGYLHMYKSKQERIQEALKSYHAAHAARFKAALDRCEAKVQPTCPKVVRRGWLERVLLDAWMWLNVSGVEYRRWKNAGGGVYREQNEGE